MTDNRTEKKVGENLEKFAGKVKGFQEQLIMFPNA